MLKRCFYFMILVISIESCTERKITEPSTTLEGALPSTILRPVIENEGDTILNGEKFETKVFLSNDSLYRLALERGIKDYLHVTYEPQIDVNTFKRSTQKPMMAGDTAIITFNVNVPRIKKGEIVEYMFQVDMDVDFKLDENSTDTTFIYQAAIFVKGTW